MSTTQNDELPSSAHGNCPICDVEGPHGHSREAWDRWKSAQRKTFTCPNGVEVYDVKSGDPCPSCGHPIGFDQSIGAFCYNRDCWRSDDLRVHSPYDPEK